MPTRKCGRHRWIKIVVWWRLQNRSWHWHLSPDLPIPPASAHQPGRQSAGEHYQLLQGRNLLFIGITTRRLFAPRMASVISGFIIFMRPIGSWVDNSAASRGQWLDTGYVVIRKTIINTSINDTPFQNSTGLRSRSAGRLLLIKRGFGWRKSWTNSDISSWRLYGFG